MTHHIKTGKTSADSLISKAKTLQSDLLLLNVKVPVEFSRKTRPMLPDWKAEEFRNMIIFFFPIFIENLIHHLEQVRRTATSGSRRSSLVPLKAAIKVWARLAYLLRAYYAPQVEYDHLHKGLLVEQASLTIRSFKTAFKEDCCTSNLHYLLHLERIREAGHFSEISATPYESAFADVRRSYVPGTPGIPKQILSTMYLRLMKEHRHCKRKVS